MSAVALRRPAEWPDAVRAELILLAGTNAIHWIWLVLLLVFRATSHAIPRASSEPFSDVRILVWLMFFFPLAWQGAGGLRSGRTPFPIKDVWLQVIHLICGTFMAALLLGTAIGGYSGLLRWLADTPGTIAAFPLWYPGALFLMGLGNYLLGAAVALRAERPGPVLLPVFILGMMLLAILGIGFETVEHTVEYNPDGSRTRSGTTSLTVTSAALHLAFGMVAVCLSVALGRVGAFPRPKLLSRYRRTHPERAGQVRVAVPPGLRREASLARVAVRQFTLLAPRMRWPLLMTAVAAWQMWRLEAAANGGLPDDAFEPLWPVAFLWPLLVWMAERPAHPWDEAQPVGTLERRLVHAVAGYAWLMVIAAILFAARLGGAMSAGTPAFSGYVPGWVWIGLPVAMLVFYCLGTAATFWTDRPVMAGILSALLVLPVLVGIDLVFAGFSLDGVPHPVSPMRLFAAVNWHGSDTWSGLLALVWTPVFVALAAGAIHLRTRRDLYGRAFAPAARPTLARALRAGEAA